MHQPYWIIFEALRLTQRRSLHLLRLNNGPGSGSTPLLQSSPGWNLCSAEVPPPDLP